MTDIDSKTSETSTEEVAHVESQAPTSSTETVTVSVTVPVNEAAPETVSEPVSEMPNGTADGTVSEPAPASESATAEADTVAGEVAAAEAQADTVTGDVAAGESTESSAGDVEAEGAGKKKRRRRRKKKGAEAGASDAPSDAKSAHHHAPFLHLFSGGTTRKHAFSVGEEIAGRVERVEHGTVIVDLFGKATAIADVDEPRELPAIIHQAVELPRKEDAEHPPRGEEAPAELAASEAPAPIHTPALQVTGGTSDRPHAAISRIGSDYLVTNQVVDLGSSSSTIHLAWRA